MLAIEPRNETVLAGLFRKLSFSESTALATDRGADSEEYYVCIVVEIGTDCSVVLCRSRTSGTMIEFQSHKSQGRNGPNDGMAF